MSGDATTAPLASKTSTFPSIYSELYHGSELRFCCCIGILISSLLLKELDA
jgi:hypothetical protein